jgi:hypothetical protein
MTNPSSEEEPNVVISWSTTMKKSVYSVKDLANLRKKRTDGQLGYDYYNNFTNRYERPRSNDPVVPRRRIGS